MLHSVKKTIERFRMFDPGDRVGVATSGGADSVALLHVMDRIAEDLNLTLIIIYLNHGLRGEESNREDEFVRRLGDSMKILVESRKISIPSIREREKGSLEDVCRKERYKFFEEVAKNYNLNKIALGHNLNDQAETVVMKFLRGSGLEGLRGILPVRDGIYVRPLLEVSREEILFFLRGEGAEYITDSSNMDNRYLRNRIRNELIPELKELYNPRLVENVGRMSNILRLENDFIEKCVDKTLSDWNINSCEEGVKIDIPNLKSLHPALQFRVIKTILDDISSSKKGIGYIHVKSVIDLIEGGRPNGLLDLPAGVAIRREYDNLVILKDERFDTKVSSPLTMKNDKNKGRKGDKRKVNDYYYHHIEIPGSVNIEEKGMKIAFDLMDTGPFDYSSGSTVFIDYSVISFPLVIRNIRPGDRIQPFGLKGTKKVKSLFIDEKVPRNERGKIPLLVDQESVLWIPGVRLSDRAKVTNRTEKVLRAEII